MLYTPIFGYELYYSRGKVEYSKGSGASDDKILLQPYRNPTWEIHCLSKNAYL